IMADSCDIPQFIVTKRFRSCPPPVHVHITVIGLHHAALITDIQLTGHTRYRQPFHLVPLVAGFLFQLIKRLVGVVETVALATMEIYIIAHLDTRAYPVAVGIFGYRTYITDVMAGTLACHHR